MGNDGASDSLSSTSEAEVAGGANAGDPIGDNGKPLSFARIASLNLEKQAIGQKPPRNVGEGTLVPSSGSGNDLGSGIGGAQAMMMNPTAQNLAVAAAAAASMANMSQGGMSMAEAAVVVQAAQQQAAQQNMNHHHAMNAAMGHQYSNPQQQAMAAAA